MLTWATAALAVVTVLGVAAQMLWAPGPDAQAAASSATVPRGVSYYGDPLPPTHPLLKLVSTTAQVAQGAATQAAAASVASPRAPGAPGPAPIAANGSGGPLSVRLNCAWGKPGGDPYRGSVKEALTTAHLPADIVQKFAAKVAARDASDRLVITNAAISAQNSGEQFNPRSIAMTYGRTLCLNTRVNFVADHHELADLYQVSDEAGRLYSVMVPDVCSNVSVLGARGEEDSRVMGVRAEDNPHTQQHFVPEPGSLLSVLTALAALAVWTRRRRS